MDDASGGALLGHLRKSMAYLKIAGGAIENIANYSDSYTVETYTTEPSADGKYRWRVRAKNGKIVAQGEGYKRRQDRDRLLDRLFPLLRRVEVEQ